MPIASTPAAFVQVESTRKMEEYDGETQGAIRTGQVLCFGMSLSVAVRQSAFGLQV